MINALGLDKESSFKAICNGESGVNKITLFDATDFPVQIAAEVKNFDPLEVVDGKEVQRCWHLGVENVKHHRFEHQDKGDKHFIAPGFIQLECLTKEDDGDDDGENNQHQIGDFYVVHQPCTYEDHHHAAK